MDPVSIIGLTAAIQQILQAVYAYGSSVREAKTEINQLCSELLALKAALDHVCLNSNVDQLNSGMETLGLFKEAQEVLSTSSFATPEFEQMLVTTDKIIQRLLGRLQQSPGKLNAAKRGITWHLVKDDIKRDIDRLNRLKTFFILATTSDNTVLCRESYLKICAIDLRLQKQEDFQERSEGSRLREAVRKWLAPYDPYHFYEDAMQSFQEGTGSWFLDDVFQNWLESDGPPVLWLRAGPGSGKTTLLSAAIKRAHDRAQLLSDSTALAFFYCSFTDQGSQDLHNLFGSFLAQLCDHDSNAWKDVENQYVKRKGSSPQEPKKLELEAIKVSITQCSMQSSETILFLDALNESKEHSKILASFLSLIRDGSKIRVIVSSTEEIIPNVSSQQGLVVSMKASRIAKDIARVVETRLEDDERLCELPRP